MTLERLSINISTFIFMLAMLTFNSCKVNDDSKNVNEGTAQNSTLYFGALPIPSDTDIRVVFGNNFKGEERTTHSTIMYKIANGLPYSLQDFNFQIRYPKDSNMALSNKVNKPLGGANSVVTREVIFDADSGKDLVNYSLDELTNYQDILFVDRFNMPLEGERHAFDIICSAKNHKPEVYHFQLSRMQASSQMDLVRTYINKVLRNYSEKERAKMFTLVAFNRIRESLSINLEYIDTRAIHSVTYDIKKKAYVIKDFKNNIVDAISI